MTMIATEPFASPPIADSAHPRRLLLVSYHFPPVGGAGVQRPVKFVKYLKNCGWDCSVLMAANPSVPVLDKSLCDDIPEDTMLVKARTWEPGYRLKRGISTDPSHDPSAKETPSVMRRMKQRVRSFARATAKMLLQPDAQILWWPNALRAGRRLLAQHRHDAVLATAPPYSNLLLGRKLAEHADLPLLLDFRDEWDLSSRYLENSSRDRFSHSVQSRMQAELLRSADAVIATTHASTNQLRQRLESAGGRAETVCIYNGYDPDDFDAVAKTKTKRNRFRIAYTGTLWNLTNVEPLAKAVEQLASSDPNRLEELEFQFIGRKTPPQQQWLDRIASTGCRIEVEEYCDHQLALQRMHSADALCLLLSDVHGADRVAPAKLFEYLAARREILAIVPDGETAEIVSRYFPQSCFRPDDVSGIASWLSRRASGDSPSVDEFVGHSIESFSRPRQAEQLAELLDRLVESCN